MAATAASFGERTLPRSGDRQRNPGLFIPHILCGAACGNQRVRPGRAKVNFPGVNAVISTRTGRILSILAGCGALGVSTVSTAAAPADDAHAKWKIVETFCFECHNTDDWAGKVAFDTMSPDSLGGTVNLERAIKKVRA